jgi:hypothetical protein
MKKIWNFLKHFSITENWGDSTKISGYLLFVIDAVREILGLPINLTCPAFAKSGHASNSYHGKGEALDGYIAKSIFTPFEIFSNFIKALEKLQIFKYALGYYPFWQDKKCIGFHFDVRPSNLFWISPRQGEYHYFNTKDEFLEAVKFYKE